MKLEDKILAEQCLMDTEKEIKMEQLNDASYDPATVKPRAVAGFDEQRAKKRQVAQAAKREESSDESEEEELVDVAEGHFDGGLEEFGLQMSDHVMGEPRADGKPRRIGITELLNNHGPEGALDKICVQGPR